MTIFWLLHLLLTQKPFVCLSFLGYLSVLCDYPPPPPARSSMFCSLTITYLVGMSLYLSDLVFVGFPFIYFTNFEQVSAITTLTIIYRPSYSLFLRFRFNMFDIFILMYLLTFLLYFRSLSSFHFTSHFHSV